MTLAQFAISTGVILLTVAHKLPGWTAEGRVQALHDLLLKVHDRHKFLTDKLLPMLKPPRREHSMVRSVERITEVLFLYDYPLPFLTLQYLPYVVKNQKYML